MPGVIPVDDDHFRDQCGLFGIFGHPEAARLSYLGLYALQHRGQESAGIAASEGTKIRVHKAMGLVNDIFDDQTLDGLVGDRAIGHVRYSTAGDTVAANAQPILIDCHRGPIALAHNGNIVNATVLKQGLEAAGSIFQSTADTEVILHLYARSHRETLEDAIAASLSKVMGAFSLLFLTPDALVAARDPWGFRPLVIGKLEGRLHRLLGDLRPRPHRRRVRARGGARRADRRSTAKGSARSVPSRRSRSASACSSRSTSPARTAGSSARTCWPRGWPWAGSSPARPPRTRTSSCPFPDSGIGAALGYAQESGLPYQWGLIRNHYVGRTFIEPKQSIRSFGVRIKLNPVREILAGKRVVLIDDSIVRGTTSRKIVSMVREAGAREIHVRISSPPTTGPCYYGIDTPLKSELIASSHTVPEIRDWIGADSLAYLSNEGLLAAVGDPQGTRHCDACFSGNYPVAVTQAEDWQLKLFEKVRA